MMIEVINRWSFQLGRLLSISRGMALIDEGASYRHCFEWKTSSQSVAYRSLSISHQKHAGSCWRYSQGESQSGRDYGPLIDLPDWSYADGRSAPQGSGQLKRQTQQRQLAERIDRLATEMIGALHREKHVLRTNQRKQHQMDQHKLKTKGHLFGKKTAHQHQIPV